MAGIQNGPAPSTLILLSDLRTLPAGSKVRFLGCVKEYSTRNAVLTLEHDYPKGNTAKAAVNVDLLVNTMKSNETRVGEWVNVMGYIKDAEQTTSNCSIPHIQVQAIVLWSSGPLRLQAYEQSFSYKDEQKSNNQRI